MVVVGVLALLVPLALVGLALYGLARLVIGRGMAGAALAAAGAGVLLVGLLLVGGLVVGRDGGDGADEGPAAGPAAGEPSVGGRTPTTAAPRPGTPLRRPQATIAATGSDELPAVAPVLGDLADGDVVVVRVSGLEPTSGATVHQCPSGAAIPGECRDGLPVTVSEHQSFTVLVDLLDRFEVGSDEVDCTDVPCSIVVFGSARLELVTVFGGPAPPPVQVVADPPVLPPGADVTATATALPARSRVTFAICRPDGEGGVDCGRPSVVLSDARGRAEATLEVGAGRCGRGETCAVAVATAGSSVLAYERLHLIGRAGAAYDDRRLLLGLLGAGLLLAAALVLLRRTDWTPVEGDPFAGVVLAADPFLDDPT